MKIKNLKFKIVKYLFEPRFHFSRFQFNLVALFLMGVGLISGVYLTAEKILPKIFALNDTTQTWTFNLSTAGDYTKDAALVTIDDTGAHPIANVNKITNPAFALNNTSWTLYPISGSTTPSGWIPIPGDTNYVATNAAFLVMKYEAKIVGKADGNIAYNSADVAESRADGTPWVNISQTEAINECAAISVGGAANHLITNNESMAIARNIELAGSNWSSMTSGTGCMYGGHNDNNPGNAIAASADDTLGWTGTNDSSSDTFECPFNTTIGAADGKEQRRTFALNSGSTIWDLSGNVWEWNKDTILGADKPHNNTGAWVEWTVFAPPGASTYGTLSYLLTRPSITTYNSTFGVGKYYEGANTGGPYGFIRGGRWNSGTDAGAFALDLHNTTDYRGSNIGFRCASDSVAISQSWSSSSGRASAGGDTLAVGGYFDGKLIQSVNLGDTSTYDLAAYVYDSTAGNVGGVVTDSIAQLYYNGAAVTTSYTPVSGEAGWYKLTGAITGVASAVEAGLLVKSNKTVKVDDFTLSKAGTYSVYTTSAYSNSHVSSWDSFTPTVTATGNAAVYYQICLDNGSACSYTTGSRWQYYTAGAWANATDATIVYANLAGDLTTTAMQKLPVASQKISVKAILVFGGADTPIISSIAVGLTTDTTPPTTNASAIAMARTSGGTAVLSGGWTKETAPYFSWTAGADNAGGVGLQGYCLYLGTSESGNPSTSEGLLGISPVDTTGSTCQFIISSTSIDLATLAYRGTTWLTTSSSAYYLNIKAIDNADNVYAGASASFSFKFDNTSPTNVAYINPASGSFSNVADMNFSWPTTGDSASADTHAGVLGWQYQLNSTAGSWQGTTNSTALNLDYIPATASAYTFTQGRDAAAVVSGTNVIYFRTLDSAGNTSTDGTIRTGSILYGGAAPVFGGTDTITVTPSTSTANSFALSWPAATATAGQTVAHYYYMANTSPPSTLATLQGNASTYIDNGTLRTVSAAALSGVNKGANTVYVVAIDNAATPNYSPSNYISGTFTLNSTDPDNVGSLVASDSSIKSSSQWNVTLTWIAPTYQGAGNLTYLVKRSTDNSTFTQVGTTTGLSYVDTTPSSAIYYYKVYTKDGANATSSGTNAVSITPTGKWTSAPTLSTGPDAGSITTKKATITWTTSRTSDSKIQYGTTSASYGTVEPSNSSQVSSHSIQLTGLNPGTTYYYKAKWTDEDGNTGTSDEKSFSTAAAPTAKDVLAKNIGLTSAIIQFTSTNASKIKIYYGKTTSFGAVKETSTSTSETTYTSELVGLEDGVKYYYKINTFDSEGSEYEGTILDFTTLPRPKITNVAIQQVIGTAQPTILATWSTNTEVSSIVTYWPEGAVDLARDEVNVALTKGGHRMIVRGLLAQTAYILVVKGRDKIGNEAVSDFQKFTTATDTRPPQISELSVAGSAIPPVSTTAQESNAQLVVSWNTDESASSQVEFGEGTGNVYSQKTQEDSNLTYNHLVIITGLTPSKVYHLRAIAKDKAGNIANSIDTVTITPKATANALDLVISNLLEAFGFLGAMRR